jgi:flavin-dependent dehydrogenase
MDGSAVYHSPGDSQHVTLKGKVPLYFFQWRDFIDRLVTKATELGVAFLYNTEVLKPIEEETRCGGVEFKTEDGAVERLLGSAVLACDGHKSVLGSYYGIQYDRLNCAMVKCLIQDAAIDIRKTPELQFYMIGNGDLDYAPNFPPCVAYAFPIGERDMEMGLMLRMSPVAKMGKTVDIPDNKSFFAVWKRLKEEYPGFSDYFKGAEIKHEEITGLSNVQMVENVVPQKGIVLIGDSAGFIDPFGSSGIYSGMIMGDWWARTLSNEILELSGSGKVNAPLDGLWDASMINDYQKGFRETEIFKKIRSSYSLIGKFEWFIFKFLRTGEKINKRWKLISWLLKTA